MRKVLPILKRDHIIFAERACYSFAERLQIQDRGVRTSTVDSFSLINSWSFLILQPGGFLSTYESRAKEASPYRTTVRTVKRFKAREARWEIEEPAAVRCLARDLRECLTYFDFPKEWRKTIRTVNVLERAFREVRRRTRPIEGTFVNPRSAERIYHPPEADLRSLEQELQSSPNYFYTKVLTLPDKWVRLVG